MKKINFLFLIIILFPFFGFSQMAPEGLEALTITESENGTKTYSLSLKILALMTALTILPSLVLGMTAFTRIIIVMSIFNQWKTQIWGEWEEMNNCYMNLEAI